MEEIMEIKLSVREFVEFIFRSGDIDNRRTKAKEKTAMEAGSRLHRKLQKQMGSGYEAEVSLRYEELHESYKLVIEGRADGIFRESGESFLIKMAERLKNSHGEEAAVYSRFPGNIDPCPEDGANSLKEPDLYFLDKKLPKSLIVIDEIKGIYRDPHRMREAVPVHKAQAMCYAYFQGKKTGAKILGVQMTYANLETEEIKRFYDLYTMEELSSWFSFAVHEYDKWAAFSAGAKKELLASIRPLQFPFEYRPGQKKLAAGVYRTIEQKKELFIQAPTGIGKTMSVLFPSVKAIGEGHVDRIFYLTAKTITRTVAMEAFDILRQQGLKIHSLALTAKEKICPEEKAVCNPSACPYAAGHYDRVNDAIYEILVNEDSLDRDKILAYAKKHQVCPFEFSLDLTLFCEGIICDYNYVYDPNVYLRRFFGETAKNGRYVFLVDEAHNLPDRAREMFSARLVKEEVLEAKRYFETVTGNETADTPEAVRAAKKAVRELRDLNKKLLALKKEFDQPENTAKEIYETDPIALQAFEVQDAISMYLEETRVHDQDKLLDFYFELRHFNAMYETLDENYMIYESSEKGQFLITLLCANPAGRVHEAGGRGISTIFFSATMLPMGFYRELLTTDEKAYAIYVPSPFDNRKRLLLTGSDVSSRYTMRGPRMYERILDYMVEVTGKRSGNYMVFFPSYQYMEEVAAIYYERYSEDTIPFELLLQTQYMKEEERDEFLCAFRQDRADTLVGFCVIGGIFSEGIDLTGESLIGAFIVGTGLSQVNARDDLLRSFFEDKGKKGYDYAYRYPGINKVFQAAGRVIRTADDTGLVVLMDNRMLEAGHVKLFPMDWENYEETDLKRVGRRVEQFWKEMDSKKKN